MHTGPHQKVPLSWLANGSVRTEYLDVNQDGFVYVDDPLLEVVDLADALQLALVPAPNDDLFSFRTLARWRYHTPARTD